MTELDPSAARLFDEAVAAPYDIEAKPLETHDKPRPDTGSKTRWHELNTFVDVWSRNLTTNAQAVWVDLFRETRPNGLVAISVGQIADRRGVSRSTAERALKELRSGGHLTVVKRGNSRQHTPNLYRVHAEPVEQKGSK